MESLKEQWANAPLWQRILVLAILPIVVVGMIWFYVIEPKKTELQELISKEKSLKQEINRYRRLLDPNSLKALEKQLERLKKEREVKKRELEAVVGKIPKYNEVDKVLDAINTIAIRNDILITSISIGTPKTLRFELIDKNKIKILKESGEGSSSDVSGVPLDILEVKLKLKGKAIDVYSFVHDIASGNLLSYPSSLSISSDNSEGSVVADFVMNVVLQR